MQVDPIKPMLKAPGSKRLKLECDQLPSSFAFKLNLRHYIKAYKKAALRSVRKNWGQVF